MTKASWPLCRVKGVMNEEKAKQGKAAESTTLVRTWPAFLENTFFFRKKKPKAIKIKISAIAVHKERDERAAWASPEEERKNKESTNGNYKGKSAERKRLTGRLRKIRGTGRQFGSILTKLDDLAEFGVLGIKVVIVFGAFFADFHDA